MIVYAATSSLAHDPELFFRRGKTIPHPERAERFRVLKRAVVAGGHDLRPAAAFGREILTGVHEPGYVDFLETAWARRAEVDPDAEELLTTQFARAQMNRRPSILLGLLGFYTADTSTPIRADTWPAVMGAAAAAASAADAAVEHGAAYALSRPPGHHAFADCAGGFCYLNNTAVAAQRLRSRGAARVAILDIDVHHGNGTQGIFYERADVLTVSVHADTASYFPFYCGYADETGAGEGAGFNLNLPLPHRSGDGVFLAAVGAGLDRIRALKPDALVVALGLDAAADDPLGVLDVTTEGFAQVADRIAAEAWPSVLVQEGGYLCDALPRNLTAFLSAFEANRRKKCAVFRKI